MAKEGKTARELEELIYERLAHHTFDVAVFPLEEQRGDFGARVFGGVSIKDWDQKQVDQIVADLRAEYLLVEG